MVLKGEPLASGAVYQMHNDGEPWPVKPSVEILAAHEYPEGPTLDMTFFTSQLHDWRSKRRDEAASGTATVRIEQLEWEDRPAHKARRGWACGTMEASYVATAWLDEEPMGSLHVSYTASIDFIASVEERSPGPVRRRDGDDKPEKRGFDEATERLSDELGL